MNMRHILRILLCGAAAASALCRGTVAYGQDVFSHSGMTIAHSEYADLVVHTNQTADKVFGSIEGRKADTAELLDDLNRLIPMVQERMKQPAGQMIMQDMPTPPHGTSRADMEKQINANPAVGRQIKELMTQQLNQYNLFRLALDEPGAVQAYQTAIASGGKPAAQAKIDRAAADWLNAYQDAKAQETALDALRAAISASGIRPSVQLWWHLWTFNRAASEASGTKFLAALEPYTETQGPRLREIVEIALKHLQLADKRMTIDGTLLSGAHYSTSALKGKVVLVVGWVTGAPSCGAGISPFQNVLDKFHPQGLEVLGIDYASSLTAAKAQMTEHPECKFPVMFQLKKADPIYGCAPLGSFRFGVPAMGGSMLIDRKGVMHYIDEPHDMDKLEAELVKWLDVQP
jgi:peroxiredoxin